VLNLRNDAMLYDTQKELLDAHHERTGVDLFVATFGLLKKSDGTPASYCVWAVDVDTLLPCTDLVAFAFKRDGEPQTLLVRWADACRVAGERMETTGESPERLRVRTFPDAAQLQVLEGLVCQP